MKIILIVILFFTNPAWCQNEVPVIDPRATPVSDWNSKYEFTALGSYDHDLQQWTRRSVRVHTTVVVKMEGTKGRLIVFSGAKSIFDIESCTKFDGYYQFSLKNINGVLVQAKIQLKGEYVYAFWLTNPQDNTSTVAFD
jgi:hypothetical protein